MKQKLTSPEILRYMSDRSRLIREFREQTGLHEHLLTGTPAGKTATEIRQAQQERMILEMRRLKLIP